ncbi:hypothetical protein Tco_0448520 [Tanacetum coccineum]
MGSVRTACRENDGGRPPTVGEPSARVLRFGASWDVGDSRVFGAVKGNSTSAGGTLFQPSSVVLLLGVGATTVCVRPISGVGAVALGEAFSVGCHVVAGGRRDVGREQHIRHNVTGGGIVLKGLTMALWDHFGSCVQPRCQLWVYLDQRCDLSASVTIATVQIGRHGGKGLPCWAGHWAEWISGEGWSAWQHGWVSGGLRDEENGSVIVNGVEALVVGECLAGVDDTGFTLGGLTGWLWSCSSQCTPGGMWDGIVGWIGLRGGGEWFRGVSSNSGFALGARFGSGDRERKEQAETQKVNNMGKGRGGCGGGGRNWVQTRFARGAGAREAEEPVVARQVDQGTEKRGSTGAAKESSCDHGRYGDHRGNVVVRGRGVVLRKGTEHMETRSLYTLNSADRELEKRAEMKITRTLSLSWNRCRERSLPAANTNEEKARGRAKDLMSRRDRYMYLSVDRKFDVVPSACYSHEISWEGLLLHWAEGIEMRRAQIGEREREKSVKEKSLGLLARSGGHTKNGPRVIFIDSGRRKRDGRARTRTLTRRKERSWNSTEDWLPKAGEAQSTPFVFLVAGSHGWRQLVDYKS